ncbi:MAG: MFS transporter [Candidatus Rokubacteria bacterium]|nr:MFS transporter [Candidatus Rokubacteria bacterium]
MISRDGRLLFATYAVRMFAYGFLSVVLGPYLASLGLAPVTIGWIFTASLAGGALMTVGLTAVADRVGRRRVQAAGAVLMLLAGVAFALSDRLALLVVAATLGAISPSGKDVGPFLAVEQAMLPETTAAGQRTRVFATYNLVGSLAGAVGALAAGLPGAFGLETTAGYRTLLWGYAAAAAILLGLYTRLSSRVEAAASEAPEARRWLGVSRSRGIVGRLAALFALDAFAGGFVVQGLVAYWFYLRWGLETTALAGIFFGTNLLAALSFLLAAPIARRIGLLNTMVFTHLPSNVLLLLIPLMPDATLAVTMLLLRHLASQLDVPTRQSYTMAVVDPDERAAAAGLLAVARNGAAAVAPAFAGAALVAPALGLPFVVAGGLKIVYDLWVFALFRGLRPPEERA